MSRSVLLLRAVNVSGRNRVPMPELREALEPLLGEVSTYIASGNVICEHPRTPEGSCADVRALISERFGVDTPVILRTHDALVEALEKRPFEDASDRMLHAMFLEGVPRKGAVEALEERLVAGERIALVGEDLWIDYGEGGVQSSKLTKAAFDKALGVAGTARNLRTIRRLAELTA